MILSCQNLSKSFGEEVILDGVSFQMEAGEKYAVVGPNGCGKSTLLKLIAGQMSADAGDITFARDVNLGYLAQYQDDSLEGNILDIVLDSCRELIAAEAKLRAMETRMSQLMGEELNQLLEDYQMASESFERMGGLTFRSEATGILKGLGFAEEDFGKTPDQLSGGQLTRVFLAKLLLLKPDLLILDEPINHLDLASIQWLETFLGNYRGGLVIVAHDRYFLDRIVDHVLDLSNHTSHSYKGNYSAFSAQRERMMETLRREYAKQQKAIEHQEAVIDRLRQFNREKSIRRADSRQKILNKMEIMQEPIEEEHAMRLELTPEKESGKDVLTVENLSMGFGEQELFRGLNLLIRRGERLAVLGENGTGKTTLLKIINQKLTARSGQIRLGANVTVGYYDQAQQELDDSKSLFEEMADTYPSLTNTKIRNVLAAFLFTGEDVYKKISSLSGGERGRLSLAKLMLSGANFLILDEPTNHLDMESKDILERALNGYRGTLLYVSHDRYFVNRTATRILELRDGHFTEYLGNYDYFLAKKQEAEERNPGVQEQTNSPCDDSLDRTADGGKANWAEQKRMAAARRKLENAREKLEEEIAGKEKRIREILQLLEDPAIATNSAKLNDLSAEQGRLQDQIDGLYEAWASLDEN